MSSIKTTMVIFILELTTLVTHILQDEITESETLKTSGIMA